MINYINLNGSIRKELGSANTNRLRKNGFLPAVIYGNKGKENIFFSIQKKDFDKEYLKGDIQLKLFEITIDSKKYKVIPYQIDIDPITDLPRHIDFVNIEEKKQVKVYIPIKYIGSDKSPGVKKGGFFNVIKRKINFYVNPLDFPKSIDVDVSMLHIGKNIKINQVQLPNNVKVVDKDNFTLCSVTGRGKSEETAPTTATPTTDATATTTTAPTADAKADTKQSTEKEKTDSKKK